MIRVTILTSAEVKKDDGPQGGHSLVEPYREVRLSDTDKGGYIVIDEYALSYVIRLLNWADNTLADLRGVDF